MNVAAFALLGLNYRPNPIDLRLMEGSTLKSRLRVVKVVVAGRERMYREHVEPWVGLSKGWKALMKPLLLTYCYNESNVADDSFVREQG